MKILFIIALLFPVISLSQTCKNLKWELSAKNGHWGTWRGKVTPGTDVIFLELRNSSKVIAQGVGYPNPEGTWEIKARADYRIRNQHRVKFICKTY